MKPPLSWGPPFLVFPDRAGGFFVFEAPERVFAGTEVALAEAWAQKVHGWVAGGLQYAAAESPAPGWWGVFERPRPVTEHELRAQADASPVVVGALSSPVSEQDYKAAFSKVRAALVSGHSYQVNLTFPVEGIAVSGPPWSWRSALRLWLDLVAAQGREASFAVLGSTAEPGPILVSASPELFFSREGEVVEARPMKGTAPRDADPARDAAHRHELHTSTKTRAENLMVTDMLRNDLGRLAVPGGVTVPRLYEVEEYPTVWQMTSTVRAVVRPEVSLSDLLGALFPCASITGAPKVSTQTVIAEAETSPRGWYTGTLGWHRPGSALGGPPRSRFSVLIRTPVFDQGPAFRLGVGGGVVWDSDASGEWREAWDKTRFLKAQQRRFSLTEAILWEPGLGFFLLEEHERRLGAACRAFGGRLPQTLRGALEAAVAESEHASRVPLKLRVLVDPEFRLTVEAEPLSSLPDELTVALASHPFEDDSLLWRRFKTTNRAVYEAQRVAGVDQTLHFNQRGELTESTSMSLVLETDGRFLTPALECGLLDGTFRAHLLAEGRLTEARIPVAALDTADRIWLVNSVRRWKPARLVKA